MLVKVNSLRFVFLFLLTSNGVFGKSFQQIFTHFLIENKQVTGGFALREYKNALILF